eukprot:CAMPEP_0206459166 /NCGR_PEP_ID=MMETSP0324_2-20121206/24014_1 /ASSEMBLY_ACC=CAM_ASM_000836 /TAXON_ID=2866 /ORGANISM="Crypthecodinium cohnii, Strain Seligo" /LENGTH=64 /DNA_ID=CAMNT_0053930665 /DNA_START=123 /DNA_END=314 /DNA_ORIENTATION=+
MTEDSWARFRRTMSAAIAAGTAVGAALVVYRRRSRSRTFEPVVDSDAGQSDAEQLQVPPAETGW